MGGGGCCGPVVCAMQLGRAAIAQARRCDNDEDYRILCLSQMLQLEVQLVRNAGLRLGAA